MKFTLTRLANDLKPDDVFMVEGKEKTVDRIDIFHGGSYIVIAIDNNNDESHYREHHVFKPKQRVDIIEN